MRGTGVTVVVSEPLVISDRQVIIINPSHLEVVGVVRVSRAGEHLRSENVTAVTDFDCCDVVIDNQRTDGPSDDGDAFAIWGVNYRTAYGKRIHSPNESCRQDHAKRHSQSRSELNKYSQPWTRQTLRAAEGDEREDQEKSKEHNRTE